MELITDNLQQKMWLGTANYIGTLKKNPGGFWVAVDSTGCAYDQRDFPEGLQASRKPYEPKTMKPWPSTS